jgi:saccharopine dehydrogenase-like NADP-dependent oxidoreductase
MQRIFVIGAGKSSTVLIQYLLDRAEEHDWFVTVGDMSEAAARSKVNNHTRGDAIFFDVYNENLRKACIQQADLIVSLLPANMHGPVAKDCIQYGKHFVSASYVSPEMQDLDASAKERGVILLNECGLDPGIDHMSAMRMIHEVKREGGQITCFESYAGGLISPESDTNPWHYKMSWNPRNIVLAGQGITKFYWRDSLKIIPYSKLFSRYDILEVPGYGSYEGYPNRDSTRYKSFYELETAHTVVRGTLRKRGYCDAWDVLIKLGLTDENYTVTLPEGCSWKTFTDCFLPYEPGMDVQQKFVRYFGLEDAPQVVDQMEWLGLFSEEPVGATSGTPAGLLQALLEKKWKLEPGDKDMIVMLHKMEFSKAGKEYEAQMSLTVSGEDEVITAMAKTVGLPAGIAAKLILTGAIQKTGVVIPVTEDIYIPILDELNDSFGMQFIHELKEMANG